MWVRSAPRRKFTYWKSEDYGPYGEVLLEARATGAHRPAQPFDLAVLPGCNNGCLALEYAPWQITGDPTGGAWLVADPHAGEPGERL